MHPPSARRYVFSPRLDRSFSLFALSRCVWFWFCACVNVRGSFSLSILSLSSAPPFPLIRLLSYHPHFTAPLPGPHPSSRCAKAPELVALVEAISQIEIKAPAEREASSSNDPLDPPAPTVAIGSDTQALHVAGDRLDGLCGAINKQLTTILDKYQEASHLLDRHLESIVTPLILLARDTTLPKPIQAAVFSTLYTICKVRGYSAHNTTLAHTHTHTRAHAYTHTRTHTRTRTNSHTHTHSLTLTHTICTDGCVYIYI